MERASLLCVGDVHLGRRPGRVPPDLARDGVEPAALTPRAAFERVVREAQDRRVSAVVFLGDVVDDEEHYLEAYSVLERGVRELVDARIEVVAVAGNHDVRALPKLADEVPGFRLLGRGGRWEQHELTSSGKPLARLVGWSFPRARVEESPLPSLALEPRDGLPAIGLLHCELDARSGPYAPVLRRELEAAGLDAWLLGHVHAPMFADLAQSRPLGYLGSLTGLDPSETGPHGPWLLTLQGGRELALEQLPLAPLRWAEIDVPVDGLAEPEDLNQALTAALRAFAEREGERLGAALAVGCRLRLTGRSRRHRALVQHARSLDLAALRPTLEGRIYFVDKLIDAARPDLDLQALARSSDPPGLFARKLLSLRAGDEEGLALVQKAQRRLAQLADRRPWPALKLPAPDEAAARAHLERAGLEALEVLLAQQETGT